MSRAPGVANTGPRLASIGPRRNEPAPIGPPDRALRVTARGPIIADGGALFDGSGLHGPENPAGRIGGGPCRAAARRRHRRGADAAHGAGPGLLSAAAARGLRRRRLLPGPVAAGA